MDEAVVTAELIERLRTGKGGWSKKSLAYLGVSWPPKRGWKRRILYVPRREIDLKLVRRRKKIQRQEKKRAAAIEAAAELYQLESMPYEDYLRTDHWLNLRQLINERDVTCCLCGSDEGLQVHHKTYERRGCELLKDLCLLCDHCHDIRHHGGVPVLVNRLDILHLRNGPSRARRMVHKVLS